MRHPIDVRFGQRLKAARHKRRLSQSNLADECGVSFQQIQKYESGSNRVSVSRLVEMAHCLGVKPEDLVRGL